MSKIILEIPEDLQGKDLSKFLKDNKKTLITQKKTDKKLCDPVSHTAGYYTVNKEGALKEIGTETIPADASSLFVSVAANTSMYCDSAMDVLLKDSAKKSMKERKGMIPFIHDHDWSSLAEIGDVVNIYYQDVELRKLGFKADGTAQVLTFDANIMKEYNEGIFKKYRTGRVKQHSIGLRYVSLYLALNEPDDEYYEDEYKVWKKWIDQIINKEYVESKGYFWAVPEYTLLENSCVLFGANPLTPTLSTGAKAESTDPKPDNETTSEQPLKTKAEETDVFNLSEALNTFKLKLS